MDATQQKGFWTGDRIAFTAALALYSLCWVLPIVDDFIGFDGAREAHTAFWRLLTGSGSIESTGKFFEAIFISIGWLANELFVLGLVALRKWPLLAVRCFAFSLGIMVSWQIAFPGEFPLLIGYWFWVAAGATMLYFAANTLSRETGRPLKAIVIEPVILMLIVVPIANAAIGIFTGMKL